MYVLVCMHTMDREREREGDAVFEGKFIAVCIRELLQWDGFAFRA